MAEYVLDRMDERQRLDALEASLDAGTIDHLKKLGVGEGWDCLEVAAGGGSIADWLCRRVGATGSVLATDIDTRFLSRLKHANLKIHRHNILTDELPFAAFDLIHARALLEHLPERDKALDRMIAGLRPGRWLLVEDGDYASWSPASRADIDRATLFTNASAATFRFLAAVGSDFFYARHLTHDLRAHGLVNVTATGRVSMVQGGSQMAQVWGLAWAKLRSKMVDSGFLTPEAIDGFIALHNDPDFEWMGPVVVSASGQKPPP